MIDQAQPRTMQVPGAGLIPQGRPSVDYKEYPKMMTHPQYRPGKPTPPMKHEQGGFTYHGIGEPIRFPPVLVKTQRDEEYHASLGYVSQGKSDAAAFDRAVGAGQIPDQVAYKPLEYPKWVLGKLVQNREEEDRVAGTQTVLHKLDTEVTQRPADAPPPEVDTSQHWGDEQKASEAEIMEAVIAEIETPTEKRARLLRELAALDAEPTDAVKTVKKNAAPKKKKKAAAPLNQEQKTARSEAIKAGMARRRAAQAEQPVDRNPDDPGA